MYAIDASNNIAVDKYNFRGADSGGGGYWTGFNDLGSGYKEVTVAGPQVYGLGA